jgi:Zn-finger nucleic acid-binding protein
MTCPRCRTEPLVERERREICVDMCGECGGVWLDRGELQRMIDRAIEERLVRYDVLPSRIRFYGDPPLPRAREGNPDGSDTGAAPRLQPACARRAS